MSLTVSLHPAPPLPRTTTTYFAASASLAVLQMFRAVLSILAVLQMFRAASIGLAVYLVQTLLMLPARQGTADTIRPSNKYPRNKHNVNNGYIIGS